VGDLTCALNAYPRRSSNIRDAAMTIVLSQAELADLHLVGHARSAVHEAH
jgi:hypothetical protein